MLGTANIIISPKNHIAILFASLANQKMKYAYLLMLQKNLIPVAACAWNISPVWNQPFHQISDLVSSKLHLLKENLKIHFYIAKKYHKIS
jgi:hypothetical protein